MLRNQKGSLALFLGVVFGAALVATPAWAAHITLGGAISMDNAVQLFDVTVASAAEAALLEGCNHQGRAIMLGAAEADLPKWTSDTVGLHRLGVSIRLGDNAGLLAYPSAGFIGTPMMIKADQAGLAHAVAASVEVQPRYSNLWRIL